MEKVEPGRAHGVRSAANDFGEIANLIGDEATLGFRSEADHRRLITNLAVWSREIRCLETQTPPSAELERASDQLFRDYFR